MHGQWITLHWYVEAELHFRCSCSSCGSSPFGRQQYCSYMMSPIHRTIICLHASNFDSLPCLHYFVQKFCSFVLALHNLHIFVRALNGTEDEVLVLQQARMAGLLSACLFTPSCQQRYVQHIRKITMQHLHTPSNYACECLHHVVSLGPLIFNVLANITSPS